ncbi:MAG TPA: DNA-directed RNA polymerase subunit alpha [Armatimonadota bacterium]|nr:DNA-directed RNA polymerase subunit alpha [Armatimonadota bacterium]
MQANPEIKTFTCTERYGKFVVEPLQRGFGNTLGHALRRVMLQAIPGAAVTFFQIEGVKHEFAPIPGVVEDTTQIILNLQRVAVRLHRNGATPSEFTLRIEASGPGEVTGADIKTPPEIEVVNPEVHIAQLDDSSAALRMDLIVEEGTGYRPPEAQEKRPTIGLLPLGSIFTPVRKVAVIVEPTRVGHQTDYERLLLEVWTNGSLAPNEAVSQGARILQEYLRLFLSFGSDPGAQIAGFGFIGDDTPGRSRILNTRIEDLDFSVRTINCLKKEGITTVGELARLSEDELLRLRNFGRKSLTEVREKLNELGIPLERGAGSSEDEDLVDRLGDLDEEEVD